MGDWSKEGKSKKEQTMKKFEMKGFMAIFATGLILGLATSAFAAGKLSFGVKGGMGFMAPLIKGGDFLPEEDYNDLVDDINQDLEDTRDWAESVGGTASINLAEKITRGWDLEGHAQYKITEMFGLRGSVGYLTGMKSDFGSDLSYWDSWWGDQMTEKITVTVSASCLFISVEPVLTLPLGKFLLTLGGGPGYYMGEGSASVDQELSGVYYWGTLRDLTTDSSLSGSKIGFGGFLEAEYSTETLTMGANVGYRLTGEIETTGEARITGEEEGVPVDETEEITGKLDFSGLYALFMVGFGI
ncbi:hypothetical protein E3J48_00680 [Candidatus Aerophobetes bacterium]|uniref:Uncharacterized protein n=1 Tax=Aerophobetes bacterium TaxID=2030807 RepID=A0A523WCI0_UNCAE|nr:MAG: hypothetical protein E3J48_00680 [Candidatus Aerophobetes bacterium]